MSRTFQGPVGWNIRSAPFLWARPPPRGPERTRTRAGSGRADGRAHEAGRAAEAGEADRAGGRGAGECARSGGAGGVGGRPRRAGARARLTLSRRRLLCFVRRGETPSLPPAPRGGAGAAPGRRRRRRLSVRNAGRGGSAARGLGGRFEWSRGAEGGGGRRRLQRGWGTAAPEGQEAWPALRARGRPQCSEAAAATASAGRGVGARAAWRPRARSRRGRRTKLSASSAGRSPGPQSPCPPRQQQ